MFSLCYLDLFFAVILGTQTGPAPHGCHQCAVVTRSQATCLLFFAESTLCEPNVSCSRSNVRSSFHRLQESGFSDAFWRPVAVRCERLNSAGSSFRRSSSVCVTPALIVPLHAPFASALRHTNTRTAYCLRRACVAFGRTKLSHHHILALLK